MKENEAAVADVLHRTVSDHVAVTRSIFGRRLGKVIAQLLPAAPEDASSLVTLNTIHVLRTAKNGISYSGFEFDAPWDDEHGMGVMLHRLRVVELGGSYEGTGEWIAHRDGGR